MDQREDQKRRATAVLLLTSLVAEADSLEDRSLRVRVLSRAAHLLWNSNQAFASKLFWDAWNLTSSHDELKSITSQIKVSRDRGFVIRYAGLSDVSLAEEFLAMAYRDSKKDAPTPLEANIAKSGKVIQKAQMPRSQMVKQLRIAYQRLRDGQIQFALKTLDSRVDRPTPETIDLLFALRQKDRRAADEYFKRMTDSLVADMSSDANQVHILATYVFPNLGRTVACSTVLNGDPPLLQRISTEPSEELRTLFLRSAAQVLARSPLSSEKTPSFARCEFYFTLRELLPLFYKYTPELSAALRDRLTKLTSSGRERDLIAEDPWLARSLAGDASRTESRGESADARASALDRDSIQVANAVAAAHKGNINAREIINSISDKALSSRTRGFIDLVLVGDALKHYDVEKARSLMDSAEFNDFQRAWALLQFAHVLKRTSPIRSAESLNQSHLVARRIDNNSFDRARALIGVAAERFRSNKNQGWITLGEAIVAANEIREYSQSNVITEPIPLSTDITWERPFDLSTIFTLVAEDDLTRSINLAKTIANGELRANALLAIARSLLTPRRQ